MMTDRTERKPLIDNSPQTQKANLDQAIHHYHDLAPNYDYFTRRINSVRQKLIDALAIQAGDVVLDAGCGTGFCFGLIHDAMTAHADPESTPCSGQIIGIEPSSAMLAVAEQRIIANHWSNVQLLHCAAENARLPATPNAIVFSYTHDVIRSRSALENLFAQAAPNARVAAASTQLFPAWFVPGNWYLRFRHREYITNFDGFDRPWSLLAEYLDDFTVERQWPGERYVATGRLRR